MVLCADCLDYPQVFIKKKKSETEPPQKQQFFKFLKRLGFVHQNISFVYLLN